MYLVDRVWPEKNLRYGSVHVDTRGSELCPGKGSQHQERVKFLPHAKHGSRRSPVDGKGKDRKVVKKA